MGVSGRAMTVKPCRECGIDMIGVPCNKLYCDTCKERTGRCTKKTCGKCGEWRVPAVMDDGGAICRGCCGASQRNAQTVKVTLDIATDREVIRRFRAAQQGTQGWIDLRDEIEIRCQTFGAVQGCGFVYTWDYAGSKLRCRQSVFGAGERSIPEKGMRIYKTPRVSLAS